jgi:uncharacterized membrane protein
MKNESRTRTMILRGRKPRGERGAILVLSAAGMVLALIASALAIDIGRLAQAAREDQKIADLAALDAIRGDVTQFQSLAEASAVRNGFPLGQAGYSITAVEGVKLNGTTCQATPGAGSACVTVTSPHSNNFPFVDGRKTMTRAGVAADKDIAGFTLGSSLVNVNSSTSPLLNQVVGEMLGGSVNLSLLSWQGLAAGTVGLSALQSELAALGFSVGTVNELLDADLTLAQFYRATANALGAAGDTANANVFDILRAQAVTSMTFKLSDMIVVDQGSEASAAGAQLNLLQLVTGTATLANGTNLISIPSLAVSVPNTLSVGISLSVIEAAKIYIGPAGAGPHVTTGQVALTMTANVNILNLLGLVKVTGTFPVEVHAAGATGTLKSVSCPSKNIVVTVDPSAYSGAVKSSTLNVTTLLGLPLLDVIQTNSTSSAVDAPAQDVPFTYSSDFSPPNAVSKHVGSTPLGLQTPNVVSGTTANVNLVNLLTVGLSAGTVLSGVLSSLDTMVGHLDANLLTPLFQALGLDIGGADVTALGEDGFGLPLPACGLPTLIG